MTAVTLTIASRKGGVGKTTAALQFADAGLRAGLRVLLVDMDTQANASKTASAVYDELAVSLADALLPQSTWTLDQVLAEGRWPGLSVAQSIRNSLLAAQTSIAAAPFGRESILRNRLTAVKDQFDLIVVDTSPSMDILTINALVAADKVVFIAEPSDYGIDGVYSSIRDAAEVRATYNPELEIAGVLLNKVDRTTGSHEHTLELTRYMSDWGVPLLTPSLPLRAMLRDVREYRARLGEYKHPQTPQMVQVWDSYLTQIGVGK